MIRQKGEGARPLRQALLRQGKRDARTSGARLHHLSMTVAVLGLLIFAIASVLAVSSHQGRQHRAAAIEFASEDGAPTVGNVLRMDDHVAGSEKYWVQATAVTVDQHVPAPDIISHWPSAGEAIVSPRLHRILAQFDDSSRYGTIIGEFDPDLLPDPGELLVWYAPLHPASSNATSFTGIGVDPSFITSDHVTLYSPPVAWVVLLFVGGGVLPAVIAVAVAAQVGRDERQGRIVTLQRMGANTSERWSAVASSLLPAWVVASFMVLCGVVAARIFGIPLLHRTVVSAEDVPVVLLVCLVVLVGVLGPLVVFAGDHLRIRPGQRRATVRVPKVFAMLAPWVTPLATVLAVVVTPMLAYSPYLVPAYAVMLILVIVGLRSFSSLIVTLTAGGWVSWATRRGWVSGLVAAREIEAAGRAAVGPGVLVAIFVLAMGHAVMWAGAYASQYVSSQQLQARVGDNVMEVTLPSEQGTLQAWVDQLPQHVHPVALVMEQESVPGTGFTTSKDVLFSDDQGRRLLGVGHGQRIDPYAPPPAQPWVSDLLGWTGAPPDSVVKTWAAVPERVDALYLMAEPGEAIPVDRLNRLALSRGGLEMVQPLGQGSLDYGSLKRDQADWITGVGVLGAVVLLVGGFASAAEATRRSERRIVGLARLGAPRSLLAKYRLVRLLVPTCIPVAVAVVVYEAMPVPLGKLMGDIPISHVLSISAFLSTVVLGVAVALFAGRGGRATRGARLTP